MSIGKVIALAIGGFLASMVIVRVFGHPATWNVDDWIAGAQGLVGSSTSWAVLAVILIGVSMLLKAPWNRVVILPLVILIILGLSPFLDRTGEWIDRRINHGDGSEPAGYVRTVSNGTVKFTRLGQTEQFYAQGTVRLLNHINYACLEISPISKFNLKSQNGYRENFLTPKSGGQEMVFVLAKVAGTCSNPIT